MKWDSIFRYCQDIWAPMAAPAVVVFVAGALWRPAKQRGAVACLLLAMLTVPLTFFKSFLADAGIHILPPNLENSLIFGGGVFILSIVLLVVFSLVRSLTACLLCSALAAVLIFWSINANPALIAILIISSYVAAMIYGWRACSRETGNCYMWNRSMLLGSPAGRPQPWYKSIWFWWLVNLAIFAAIYVRFW
jgi:hypothetical protein